MNRRNRQRMPRPLGQNRPQAPGQARPQGQTVASYTRAAEQYQPVVADLSSNTTQALVKLGLKAVESQTRQDTNMHSVSASVRSVLTARTLGRIHGSGVRAVLDLYGSARTLAINGSLNRGVPAADQMMVTVYRPTVVPQDVSRLGANNPNVSQDDRVVANHNHFLMVNVYNFEDGPLTPFNLTRLLTQPNNTVHWIGHKMLSCYGAVSGEGGWVRTTRGKVIYRPDSNTAAYAEHDPLDWIWQTSHFNLGTQFLMWSEVINLDGLHVVKFMLTPSMIPNQVIQIPDKLEQELHYYRWSQSPLTRTLQRFAHSMLGPSISKYLGVRKESVYVPIKLYSYMVTQNYFSAMNNLSLQAVAHKVNTALVGDVEFQTVNRLFPGEFADFPQRLTYAVFTSKIEDRLSEMTQLAELNPQMESYNVLRYTLGTNMAQTPASSFNWTPVICGIAGLMLWKPILKYGLELGSRFITGASSIVNKVYPYLPGSICAQMPEVLIPKIPEGYGPEYLAYSMILNKHIISIAHLTIFAEELFKRSFRGGTPMFIAFEAAMKAMAGGTQVLPVYFCTAGLMHWAVSYCENPMTALFLHMLYNSAVFAFGDLETIKDALGFVTHSEMFVKMCQTVTEKIENPKVGNIFLASVFMVLGYYLGTRINFKNCFTRVIRYFRNIFRYSEFDQEIQYYRPPDDKSIVLQPCLTSKYSLFYSNAYIMAWQDRLPWDYSTRAVTMFEPPYFTVPRQKTAYYSKPKPRVRWLYTSNAPIRLEITICPDMVVQAPEGWPTEEEQLQPADNYFFVFTPHSIPMMAPSRNDANMLAVIEARILAPPPMDPMEQYFNWVNIREFLDPIFDVFTGPHIIWEYAYDPWFLNIKDKKKKKRAEHNTKIVKEKGFDVVLEEDHDTKIMVKTDEILLAMADDYTPKMKPRAIANVSPTIQVIVGPYIYEATQRVKAVWSVYPQLFTRIPVTINLMGNLVRAPLDIYVTYGGACTDEDLTNWFAWANGWTGDRAHIIVAGDDSLVLLYICGVLYIFEGDATMYDQSQSFGPLMHEYQIYFRLGVPFEILEGLFKVACQPYLAVSRTKKKERSKRLRVIKEKRPIRDTGGPNTSIGNSLVMGTAWIYALGHATVSDLASITQAFEYLGFDMKLKTPDRIGLATFLKGTWYHTDHPLVHYWSVLPSRFLKMGKSMRNPVELYPAAKGNKELAAMWFMNDLACCYKTFVQVPILRQFITNFYREKARIDLLEEHKVQAVKTQKPTIISETNIHQMYDTDALEIADAEAQMPGCIGRFWEHPLILKIAKDYQ